MIDLIVAFLDNAIWLVENEKISYEEFKHMIDDLHSAIKEFD